MPRPVYLAPVEGLFDIEPTISWPSFKRIHRGELTRIVTCSGSTRGSKTDDDFGELSRELDIGT